MPELPEVETTRRIIGPQIVGHKITDIQFHNDKVLAYPSTEEFIHSLIGQQFTDMTRKGKFLVFHFGEKKMALHLRMTGQVLVVPQEEALEKHTHLVFTLDHGMELRYIDVRRFGRFWLCDDCGDKNLEELTGISRLGIEPDDPILSASYLMSHISSSKASVKEILLDQSIVCGIGNIYADEILFESQIYPGKKCRNLTEEDCQNLAAAIPKIIAWGIEADRMSPEEYLERKGKDYSNIIGLKAYGRHGKSCPHCDSMMEKMVIKGRSSTYCPKCQVEEWYGRQDILDFGLSLPETYQDTPFSDTNWVLIRHKKNKKAFLWTYYHEEKLKINIKVDPEWRDFWRSAYQSVLPGYHQNKEHWNTIIIHGDVPVNEIKRMILDSYDLIKPKEKIKKRSMN